MIRLPFVASMSVLTLGILVAFPVRADDDQFVLRLGAIQVDGDTHINGAVDFSGDAYNYSSGALGFDKHIVPRVEGVFRFSERNRLLFNYFSYDNDDRYVFDDEIDVGGGVVLPAGTTIETKTRFDLGNLVYDFALIQTPTVSVGVQIGAAWANLEGSVRLDDELVHLDSSESLNGAAPMIGARLSTMSEDRRWGFTLQAQYLSTRWGNFDKYSGDISRANALVEYRFTNNFGVNAGYDWFRIDANRNRSNDTLGFDLSFKGPTAGVTLAF
ncbi:MAG TPA: hypothetical protein VFN25_14710 [Dokdonella sp.]|uniref:hypothetical protein n=1 Tax=Dokdonella sp. TaxID=2291710 RepID=UPI002D80CCF4|nr:hypothetical protein [Dokdonella sp.]HET9034142.1 hypothetical protein [Dokdonella sp.]